MLIVLAVVITNGPGDHPSRDSAVPAPPTPSPAPRPSTPAPEPEAPEETGVRLGDEPFVYACRVLPEMTCSGSSGLGRKGNARQQYLDRTPTDEPSSKARATFAYGGLSTECTLQVRRPGGHTLEVIVTQYPTTRLLERRWSPAEPEQGPPGRGLRRPDALPRAPALVRRPQRRLTVEVRYVDLADTRAPSRSPRRSSRRSCRGCVAKPSTSVDTVATERRSRDRSPRAPASRTRWAARRTSTPCAVLDAAAFEALGGTPPEPVVVDTSGS